MFVASSRGDDPAIVQSEFIFETAPFAQCHASTIVETKSGLVSAWFGGTKEGNPDVGIWLSRQTGGKWSAPVEVANGIEPHGKGFACFNPVLFQPPHGPLLLFYKIGGHPKGWRGYRKTSDRRWRVAVTILSFSFADSPFRSERGSEVPSFLLWNREWTPMNANEEGGSGPYCNSSIGNGSIFLLLNSRPLASIRGQHPTAFAFAAGRFIRAHVSPSSRNSTHAFAA